MSDDEGERRTSVDADVPTQRFEVDADVPTQRFEVDADTPSCERLGRLRRSVRASTATARP